MLNLARLFLCLLLFCFPGTFLSEAQPRCSIEHFSSSNGLSDNKVMCMIRDREGFMWFGTWTGINRFDGDKFVTYKSHPGDRSELANNRIDEIVEDRAGFLWVKSYDKQVYRFDKRKEKFFSLQTITGGKIKGIKQVDKIILLNNYFICLKTKTDGAFFFESRFNSPSQCIQLSKTASGGGKLPSNTINFVHQDSRSHIWIGTSAGLRAFSFKAIRSGDPGEAIFALNKSDVCSFAEDTAKLWFGTSSGLLLTVDKKTLKTSSRKVSDSQLNALKVSHDRRTLYGTTSSGGVIQLDLRSGKLISAQIPGKQALLSVYEDSSGLLWIEPENSGVVFFDPSEQSFRYFTQQNYSNYIHDADEYQVSEDRSGVVWVNMKGCGFGYYDRHSRSFNHFYDKSGSTDYRFSNMISAMFYDPCGILWLSSDDGGIEKVVFQPNDFGQTLLVKQTYYPKENEVRGMGIDHLGRFWAGTKASRLYVFNNRSRVNITFLNTPAEGMGGVYSVLADNKNNIWLGTKGNGLLKATPVNRDQTIYRVTRYIHSKDDAYSINSDIVYSLFEDKKGRVWAGTFGGGLNLVDESQMKVRFFHKGNKLKGYPRDAFSRIRHIAPDAAGNIWIGTTDGLLIFDPTRNDPLQTPFTRIIKVPGNKESLGDNDVQFIYRDSENSLWICTSGGGLNKAIFHNPFKSLKFRNYSKQNGLPSDYLLSCVEDKHYNLWIATQNGLARFNLKTQKFRNYDATDGLPVMNFAEAASLRSENNELIFGTSRGYIRFLPEKINDRKINANIALTNFQVNNEDVVSGQTGSPLNDVINNTSHVTLRHNQNILSIDYCLLDYRSESRKSYAYRLLGFDSIWYNNKEQTRATYTNLPPGEYVFQVRSNSSDLYLNVPQRSLEITILPPPWATWWARMIYLTIVVVLFILIRRTIITMFRLRQGIIIERKLTDLKLSFFTNISHELRTPLTLIVNPLEEIAKNKRLSTEEREHLNLVRRNAGRMVRFVNQLLDLRKAQSGKSTLKISCNEVSDFINKVTGYFSDLSGEKKIAIEVHSPADRIFAWFDAEKMDIVIYNLLANAFKFAREGTSISIKIEHSDTSGNIVIEVSDEGCGVPESQLAQIFGLYFRAESEGESQIGGTGIGLALSREFIDLHGGRIYALNNDRGGLTVRIELKPGTDHFDPKVVVFAESPAADYNNNVPVAPREVENTGPFKQKQGDRNLLLLVEDNSDMRSFLHMQLSPVYEIETANDGEEGLLKAVNLIPDVIISDVMMPKMDGIAMLDRLKNNPVTSHVPIILLSAKTSVENQIVGLKYGADYYITKPFSNEFLLASIRNLIQGRRKLFESMLIGRGNDTPKPTNASITNYDELFLKEVMDTVDGHMKDSRFNIDLVADTMNMSRSTFYKKLKSLTNMAPVEFVREMRLKRALGYLESGEYDIASVAYSVGFKNAKYFATCFRQRFCMSPTEYIRKRSDTHSGRSDIQMP